MIKAILVSVFVAVLATAGVYGAKRTGGGYGGGGGGVQQTGMTTSSNSTSTSLSPATGAGGTAST